MNEVINSPHKVFARKYRPTHFKDLIGQEGLVTVINNSVKLNSIAHAILLSGIRGVGKTTSARIIAKVINCTNPKLEEIIEACCECDNCRSFSFEKHPDIIEIDAASKTGVSDIREIIDNCNYLPLLGKYKIYIIDEIHMLSNNAFNALLKTLEEPPNHVIFIFATTEVKKLPITILSRCQKFYLKRVDNKTLFDYVKKICEFEDIEIEDQALKIIINNAEGSVRDSLSLLDQTKNLVKDEIITVKIVSQMLGSSDMSKKYDLLNFILKGDTRNSLTLISEIYYDGYDLILLLQDILELITLITKIKITEDFKDLLEWEVQFTKNIISSLSISSLSSLWQILLKSLDDVKDAPVTLTATEMVIIKLCYAANLPSPIEMIEKISSNSMNDESNQNNIKLNSFSELIDLVQKRKELILYNYLVQDIYIVKFEFGEIEIGLADHASDNLIVKLSSFLYNETKQRWNIKIIKSKDGLTIGEIKENEEKKKQAEFINHPVVKSILDNFSSANIVQIRNKTIQ